MTEDPDRLTVDDVDVSELTDRALTARFREMLSTYQHAKASALRLWGTREAMPTHVVEDLTEGAEVLRRLQAEGQSRLDRMTN